MQSVRRTAKIAVVALEDTSEITQAFEAAIFADYDARNSATSGIASS